MSENINFYDLRNMKQIKDVFAESPMRLKLR